LISQNVWWACEYARGCIKGRWEDPLIELDILKSKHADRYVKGCAMGTVKETREQLLRSLTSH